MHGILGAAGLTFSALVQPLREHNPMTDTTWLTNLRAAQTFFEQSYFQFHTYHTLKNHTHSA